MSKSYNSSPPWRLHGIARQLYFTFTTKLLVFLTSSMHACYMSRPTCRAYSLILSSLTIFHAVDENDEARTV
jgi:hypothetical protein